MLLQAYNNGYLSRLHKKMGTINTYTIVTQCNIYNKNMLN